MSLRRKYVNSLCYLAGLSSLLCFVLVAYHPPSDNALTEKSTILLDQNIRGEEEDSWLVYNRITKSGSGSMIAVLNELQYINKFYLATPQTEHCTSECDAKAMVMKLPKAGCFVAHFQYVNFTTLGFPGVTYMNMIRDPVSMFLSGYFFKRIPLLKARKEGNLTTEIYYVNKEIQKCYFDGGLECRYIPGRRHEKNDNRNYLNIPYFCGTDDFCSTLENDRALQQAKFVIENEYKVVGVLEDLNMTITVLENVIPRFFKGAYYLMFETEPHRVHTLDKGVIEFYLAKIRFELRRNMSNEYELYEFVKQRLHKQYDKIMSLNATPAYPNHAFQALASK